MQIFTKGILLEQHKEPMLSRSVLVMRQEYEYFDCDFPDVPLEELSKEQIIEIARLAKIVDECDGRPLAEKLEENDLFETGTLIIDAIDDEPYISSQMGVALHNEEKVALAAELCKKVLRPKSTYVAMYKHIFDTNMDIPKTLGGIPIERVGGRYPAEERAYKSIRSGKNSVVIGVCAMVHLARAAEESRVMTSCFLTVAGSAVANPRNIEAPIGTTVEKILELCGLSFDPEVIVVGGSMTGRSVYEPEEETVSATTRGVLAIYKSYKSKVYDCIGCGRCDHACPEKLSIFSAMRLASHGDYHKLGIYDVDHCTGCGACSYVCPARIDVAASMLKIKRTLEEKKEETK